MSKIGSAKPVLATLVQSALLRTNLLKKRPNPTVFYLPGLTNSSPIVTERMNQLYGDISKKLEDNYDVIVKEYVLFSCICPSFRKCLLLRVCKLVTWSFTLS